MENIYKKARAKINLTLEILNKREDNYHNLKSVFQKINLYDEIYIYKIKEDKFILKTNTPNLKVEDNIIYKAYIALKEKCKNITGIKVILKKNIPMQAGMAGGSTDCASFILAMNKLFHLNLNKKEIEEISKSLGADVVPCLYNRAVLAEGIGEIITKINTNFKYYIVIIKPTISCNTKEMFKKIDEEEVKFNKENTAKMIHSLENNDIDELSNNLYNSFEKVIKEKEIEDIKTQLRNNNAIGTLLTGSGSCVYGIFRNREMAKRAYKKMKNQYETYICTSYNSWKEEKF